jgi:hypothetical protein
MLIPFSYKTTNDKKFSTPNTIPKIIETLEKYQFEMWNDYQHHNSLDNSILLNEFVTTKIQAFESNRKFDGNYLATPKSLDD